MLKIMRSPHNGQANERLSTSPRKLSSRIGLKYLRALGMQRLGRDAIRVSLSSRARTLSFFSIVIVYGLLFVREGDVERRASQVRSLVAMSFRKLSIGGKGDCLNAGKDYGCILESTPVRKSQAMGKNVHENRCAGFNGNRACLPRECVFKFQSSFRCARDVEQRSTIKCMDYTWNLDKK